MALHKLQNSFIVAAMGLVLSSAFSNQSFGQNTTTSANIKRDTVVVEAEGKFPVVTNMFWDNWFVGVGAGAQILFSDHDKQMDFGDRLSPAFNIYAGKSFSPGLAVRLAFDGFKYNGLTQNKSYSTGEVFDASRRLEKQEIKYIHLRADVLFNLSNLLQGYKATRVYNLSPYAGLGWMSASEQPKANEVSATVGLLNAFRLTQALDLTLDVRGSMVEDRFDGETGNRRGEGVLSTSLGLAYKFKKRDWDKPKTTIISYDDAELLALRDKVNALEQDNDALKKQLAGAKTATITDVKLENKILASPILVTFPINKSVVSNEARVNLGFFAKAIKEGTASVVYKVTGYADKGTGTAATNERLSRKRATAIYNVLVREFSVSPDQLQIVGAGGVDNMFYDDPRLSRAVITIAQ
jgi:outer membrane protein OmpA-like peptidoglycan-associated protein